MHCRSGPRCRGCRNVALCRLLATGALHPEALALAGLAAWGGRRRPGAA